MLVIFDSGSRPKGDPLLQGYANDATLAPGTALASAVPSSVALASSDGEGARMSISCCCVTSQRCEMDRPGRQDGMRRVPVDWTVVRDAA